MSEVLEIMSRNKRYIYSVVGGIALLVVAVFIAYNKGAADKDQDWELEILKVQMERDTVWMSDTLGLLRRIEVVEAMPGEPMPELRDRVDSLIAKRDSLEALVHELVTSYRRIFDYTLLAEAKPPDRIVAIELRIKSMKLEKVQITERTTILKPHPIWRKPLFLTAGAAALGAGATYFLLSARKGETRPAVELALPKPPGRP